MDLLSIRVPGNQKAFTSDATGVEGIEIGDACVVDMEGGLAVGEVISAFPGFVRACCGRAPLARVLRKANEEDAERIVQKKEREAIAFQYCRERSAEMGLVMKLVKAECAFDGRKITFTFTADGRVDFRALVRDLAARFHTRIEMRQIGVRDEAKVKGGFGPCGKVLCCTAHLADFKPVSVKMAKEQGLTLNPAKISGVCGRLMCCLRYEQGCEARGAVPPEPERPREPLRELPVI